MGLPGFFTPRWPMPLPEWPNHLSRLSYYDTAPLRQTLLDLVDFERLNSAETRFSVGAVNMLKGNFAYFDNTERTIGPEHIMASGALPRASRRWKSTANGTGTAASSPTRRCNTCSTTVRCRR
ncbi:patatin-like phospholipase family protein [Novosphingobium resinovorum]